MHGGADPGNVRCSGTPKGTIPGRRGRCSLLSESDCIFFSEMVTEKHMELESAFSSAERNRLLISSLIVKSFCKFDTFLL